MTGQGLIMQAGTLVPILGGLGSDGAAVPSRRQDLVPGTYKPSAATTGLWDGYTWSTAGIIDPDGTLIPGSVINGDVINTGTDTLLDSKVVNGRIINRGTRNVSRNCVVRGTPAGAGTGPGGMALWQCDNTVQDAQIEDSILVPQTPGYNWTAIFSHDGTARRVNAYRTVDSGGAFRADLDTKMRFHGCWFHDLTMYVPDPNHPKDVPVTRTHNDIIQIQGGFGTEIIGCWLQGHLSNWPVSEGFVASTSDVTTNPPNPWAPPHVYSASGRCVSTSVIQVTRNVGTTVHDITIRDNWIEGGAVGINFSDPGLTAGSFGSAGDISGNRFDHWQGLGGSATSTTGHTIDIGATWTVERVTGNVYDDTGLPVQVRSGLRGN